MRNYIKKLTIMVSVAALFVAESVAAPPAKTPPGPPTIYGAQLPVGAVRLQLIAGSASYKAPEEIRLVEKFYRGLYELSKDVAITERTVGGARMVVFEDRGQRPWSTIQISGVAGEKESFLIVCNDRPAQIDQFP